MQWHDGKKANQLSAKLVIPVHQMQMRRMMTAV